MISRVAETCFWLSRYMERVENTARILQVNGTFLLDIELPALSRWRPAVIVAGEEERFAQLVGEEEMDDGEAVQEYLVWDARSPVSLVSSLGLARGNARTIREVISLEAWTALNAFWLWLGGHDARRLYARDRPAFYERVLDSCRLFGGACQDTMPHDEPFDFMRLGTLLERAEQTARILDMKYHTLGPTTGGTETPAEAAEWLAILRSCSATEPFFKWSVGGPTGPAVVEFLLFDRSFPRTVLYALTRAWHFLQRVRPDSPGTIGNHSARLLDSLLRHLRSRSMERIVETGIHAEVTALVSRTAEVCEAIRDDYFVVAPRPPRAAAR